MVPQSNEALPSDEIPLNRGTTGLSKFSVRNFECFIHISPKKHQKFKKIDFVAIATEGDFLQLSIRILPKLLKMPKSS